MKKKTAPLHARVSIEHKEKLKALADRQNTSITQLIQAMIDEATAEGNTRWATALYFMDKHPKTRPLLQWYAGMEDMFKHHGAKLTPEGVTSYRDFMGQLSAAMGKATAEAISECETEFSN